MKRRLSVSRSNIRRRNSLRLHRSLMRTDADYRIAVFKDAGFEDLWALIKTIGTVASSIAAIVKALETGFNALKKGKGDVEKVKQTIEQNSAKLKELGTNAKNLISEFLKLKLRFIFRVKTGPDAPQS